MIFRKLEIKRDVLETHLQFDYPTDVCIISSHFYYTKNENIWIF